MPEYIVCQNKIIELIEKIAALEHEQWIAWSQDIASTESINKIRLSRWQKLWRDYEDLTEEEKDLDRIWANKVVEIIQSVIIKN